jgi:hypothetical protein
VSKGCQHQKPPKRPLRRQTILICDTAEIEARLKSPPKRRVIYFVSNLGTTCTSIPDKIGAALQSDCEVVHPSGVEPETC